MTPETLSDPVDRFALGGAILLSFGIASRAIRLGCGR